MVFSTCSLSGPVSDGHRKLEEKWAGLKAPVGSAKWVLNKAHQCSETKVFQCKQFNQKHVNVPVHCCVVKKLFRCFKATRWGGMGRMRLQRGGWQGGGGQTEGESGLSVFFSHKALPSDTCHWVGMNPLSAWQEVGASKQELKGRVYANGHSQRKWVPLVSVRRPDENGTCFPHRQPFRGQQWHKVFIGIPVWEISPLEQLLLVGFFSSPWMVSLK